jgi:NADH:ubiquinone oxidoreductase subunit E
MLADKDRIFTNVYGYQDWGLKGAQARRYHVQVCGTTPCMLRGSEDLLATTLLEMVGENYDYREHWK